MITAIKSWSPDESCLLSRHCSELSHLIGIFFSAAEVAIQPIASITPGLEGLFLRRKGFLALFIQSDLFDCMCKATMYRSILLYVSMFQTFLQ